jgi:hypothetical protein
MRSIGTSVAAAVVGVVLSQLSIQFGGYTLPPENGFRIGLLIGCGVALVTAANPHRRTIPATQSPDMR